MVSLSAIRAANAQLTVSTNHITAVFVGSTSGIGRATLLLMGLNPKGNFIFLEAEVGRLAEVRRVCDEIKSREISIDLLWLSAGALPFDGRVETSEGLSMHMTLAHWGRMFFATLLLPLLKASSTNPRVVSILRPGLEKTDLNLNDLDVKRSASKTIHLEQFGAAVETMNTLYLEQLAKMNPDVVFVHKHPGLVRTDLFGRGWGTTWSMRRVIFTYILPPIVGLIGKSENEVGERGVFNLFSARYGGAGVHHDHEILLHNSMGGSAHEGAFLVNADDEAAINEKALASLRKSGASD